MSSLYDAELTNSEILEAKGFRWKIFCLDFDVQAKPKKIKDPLVWQEFKFLKKNKIHIPNEQGIYMFTINMSNGFSLNGTSNYVLYVGQASDLRVRYLSYFRYLKSDKPSDFLKRCMTLIWKGKLDFHFFSTGALSPEDLTKIEFDIIDTLAPPINQRFRGKILKKAIKLYSPR